MSDTPRTDAESFPDFENGGDVVLAEFARTLERELATAKQEIERLDVAGIHSCHDDCRRHACKMKRERDSMANALREILATAHAGKDALDQAEQMESIARAALQKVQS